MRSAQRAQLGTGSVPDCGDVGGVVHVHPAFMMMAKFMLGGKGYHWYWFPCREAIRPVRRPR